MRPVLRDVVVGVARADAHAIDNLTAGKELDRKEPKAPRHLASPVLLTLTRFIHDLFNKWHNQFNSSVSLDFLKKQSVWFNPSNPF